MLKRMLLVIVVLMALVMVGCGATSEAEGAAGGAVNGVGQQFGNGELPEMMELSLGTLALGETEGSITVEQAAELLPLWNAMRGLAGSRTAAQAETEAVLNQIKGAMTEEQLQAIEDMGLDQDDMREWTQNNAPEDANFEPGEGGGPPGGFGGGDGPEGLSQEEMEALREEMQAQGGFQGGTLMYDAVVELLEGIAG